MNTATLIRRNPLVRSVWRWRNLASDNWSLGPRPPARSVVRGRGYSPLQILLLGGGPATGYGVATHELGLGGHLARQLAHVTGRGVDLEVFVAPEATVADATRMLRQVDVLPFDAVILAVGVQDALDEVDVDGWAREVSALVSRVRAAGSPELQTYLLGVPLPSRVVALTAASRDRVDARSVRFNARLRGIAEDSESVRFLEFAPGIRIDDGRHRDSGTYREWAEQIAPQLACLADRCAADHRVDASEESRSLAVRALDILDTPSDERFDRIVATAQSRFGADGAALSFMDQDRQWFKSAIGAELTNLPRGSTLCEWTVRQRTAFVVEDTLRDEKFARLPFIQATGRRAYAGHPILDPTGTPIGVLCVVFCQPRSFSADDLSFLRQLAGLVEGLLVPVAS